MKPLSSRLRLLLVPLALIGLPCAPFLRGQTTTPERDEVLEIRAVTAGDQQAPLRRKSATVGPPPLRTSIYFFRTTNSTATPSRLRYFLEGHDARWQDSAGEMFLGVRFYNEVGDQVQEQDFKVHGESAGWNNSLETSSLTHRRETVVVPPQAAHVMILISSAGPPATMGVYVMANLVVSKIAVGGSPEVLMESPLDHQPVADPEHGSPVDWTRDGNHSTMAKIVTIGRDPAQRAFAILDDDGKSHAEWHNTKLSSPRVESGQHLIVEWNEMFSLGVMDVTAAHYMDLPEGQYRFHAASFDIFGERTGPDSSIALVVMPPIWRRTWFWSVIVTTMVAMIVGSGRYVVWHRMRREVARLKSQQALEQERLRIARDIHDDLGTRVTEISLASALAKSKSGFPSNASADFDHISGMCRELVSALYETVWAVNPENDNLEALGNFLCQTVDQLCEQAQLSCRIQMPELPPDIQVSSQTRHNIVMALKEAVNNIIKHARATEVNLKISFQQNELEVCVQDNGCGIKAGIEHGGQGLNNMRRRLEDLGGRCDIESPASGGACVRMRIVLGGEARTAALTGVKS